MHTTAIGNRGEDLVSQWLLNNQFNIIDRNWKTRWCEVDVIARKNQIIYFIEVKYRKNNLYGNGFDYITNKKQQQMQFAAEFWIKNQSYEGECRLAAASVHGQSGEIEFIDDL